MMIFIKHLLIDIIKYIIQKYSQMKNNQKLKQKENQKNQQKYSQERYSKDVLSLIKKYEEEIQISKRDIRDLQNKYYNEIQSNQEFQDAFTKKQEIYKNEIRQLKFKLQKEKNMVIVESDNQIPQLEKLQQQLQKYKEILNVNFEQAKRIKQKNNTLENQFKIAQNTTIQQQKCIQSLKKINEDLQIKIKSKDTDMLELKKQLENLEKVNRQYQMEFQQVQKVFTTRQQQLKQLKDIKTKYSNLKKKRKQEQNNWIKEKQNLKLIIAQKDQDIERLTNQYNVLTQQKDKLQQNISTLNTNLNFLTLSLSQKNAYIQNQQRQFQRNQIQKQQEEAQLKLKYANLESENKNLEKQIIQLDEQIKKNYEQFKQVQLSYEITFRNMRQKVFIQIKQNIKNENDADQILKKMEKLLQNIKNNANKESSIIKLKEKSKMYQQEIKLLKQNCQKMLQTQPSKQNNKNKSSNKILPSNKHLTTNRTQYNQNNLNINKIKYQNQINYFEMQISLLKKQMDQLKYENSQLSQKISELKKQNENKQKKMNEMKIEGKNLEDYYVQEIKKCINELQVYKQRDIINQEIQKQQKDKRQIYNLKISNYQKKIKQLIESIQRKDDIIESLKNNKKQSEQSIIFMQDKITKLIQQCQNLKKLKTDCTRKEQLMKQYKQRLQSKKSDYQNIKYQREKLKKDNERLQKSNERKSNYINTIKVKYEKQIFEIQKKLKSHSNQSKNISNVMENKFMQIKKQCENFQEIIQKLKKNIIQLITHHKNQKNINNIPHQAKGEKQKKKKTKRKVFVAQSQQKNTDQSEKVNLHEISNAKYWQATKVLGLKENEIQDFLNPKSTRNKKYFEDQQQLLQQLWQQGEIMDYFQKALQYLINIIKL